MEQLWQDFTGQARSIDSIIKLITKMQTEFASDTVCQNVVERRAKVTLNELRTCLLQRFDDVATVAFRRFRLSFFKLVGVHMNREETAITEQSIKGLAIKPNKLKTSGEHTEARQLVDTLAPLNDHTDTKDLINVICQMVKDLDFIIDIAIMLTNHQHDALKKKLTQDHTFAAC